MKKILALLVLVLSISLMLAGCGLTVPRPEIKRGEFDFSVTYELNGERVTVSGVYVCKYNGTKWALDGGSHRDWKAYVKDGMETQIEIGATEDGGTIWLNLGLYPEYFMGDPDWISRGAPEPWLSVAITDGEGTSIQNEADVIAEVYGARIVSYEYETPIKNAFGLFK